MASTIFQKPKISKSTIDQAMAMMNGGSEVQRVMSMLSGKGMTAEQMVRSICAKQGIDVNEFMGMISERSNNG